MAQHKRKPTIAQTVARDILDKLHARYQDLKGNNACVLYCYIRDYINQTYLTEKDGE